MRQTALGGKCVVITRPRHQAGEFGRLLAGQGALVMYLPTIEIAPVEDWSEVDEAIDNTRAYDAFIFTSANAVRYFFDRARDRGVTSMTLGLKTVYALGGKTAEAVAFYGIRAVRFPGVENAHQLGMAIIASRASHRRSLNPKGRLAGSEIRDLLTAQGKAVDEVIVSRRGRRRPPISRRRVVRSKRERWMS